MRAMPQALIDEIKTRLINLRGAFMRDAKFQGTHYRYASNTRGDVLIERKHLGRFYYWIHCNDGAHLIDASIQSKFAGLQTVGDVFPDGNVGSIPST